MDPNDEGGSPVKTRGGEAQDQGQRDGKYPIPLKGWWWYKVKKGSVESLVEWLKSRKESG